MSVLTGSLYFYTLPILTRNKIRMLEYYIVRVPFNDPLELFMSCDECFANTLCILRYFDSMRHHTTTVALLAIPQFWLYSEEPLDEDVANPRYPTSAPPLKGILTNGDLGAVDR